MINLEEKLSTIVRDIPPSGIRRFFDLASEMEGVISLGVENQISIHLGIFVKLEFNH